MRISLTSIYVDDQQKALRFYTEVLGFTKKADFSNGPFRWLTVASPEDPDGTQLQLNASERSKVISLQLRVWPHSYRVRGRSRCPLTRKVWQEPIAT